MTIDSNSKLRSIVETYAVNDSCDPRHTEWTIDINDAQNWEIWTMLWPLWPFYEQKAKQKVGVSLETKQNWDTYLSSSSFLFLFWQSSGTFAPSIELQRVAQFNRHRTIIHTAGCTLLCHRLLPLQYQQILDPVQSNPVSWVLGSQFDFNQQGC